MDSLASDNDFMHLAYKRYSQRILVQITELELFDKQYFLFRLLNVKFQYISYDFRIHLAYYLFCNQNYYNLCFIKYFHMNKLFV
jgi:hypothetical protein